MARYADSMTMKQRKPQALLMGGLLALAAIGCNTTLTLDDTRLEQVIATGIQTQAGVTVSSVACPADRPLRQGDTFDCTAATADGRTLRITVTQTDSEGNVHWEITGES